MKPHKPFAEIIESSLQHWLAQSWQWNDFPHFGSLITITTKNHALYGIVHNVHTGSMDPVRYPFAYKKSHEELQREQPQIFEFLKTTFTALPLGYAHNSTITYQLPPQPPPIHTFVTHASTDECRRFFADASYLHVLFGLSSSIQNIDELLLALFTHLQHQSIITPPMIEHQVETYSLLIGDEYRRLKRFLQRVEKVISL